MHAVVVFESIWGNTERLAREIAAGIGEGTEVIDAASAPDAIGSDVDLIVVGGPTHAFSIPTAATWESARQQGAETIPASGLREWLDQLASPTAAVKVATFDTRTVSPRLPGSAAKKAMKRLVALGFRASAQPESFGVHGYSGPLGEGELERARRWGGDLARA